MGLVWIDACEEVLGFKGEDSEWWELPVVGRGQRIDLICTT